MNVAVVKSLLARFVLSKERFRGQRTLANFNAYREQERASRKHHYTDNECVLQASCVMFDRVSFCSPAHCWWSCFVRDLIRLTQSPTL